jgi:hypothetical protein
MAGRSVILLILADIGKFGILFCPQRAWLKAVIPVSQEAR